MDNLGLKTSKPKKNVFNVGIFEQTINSSKNALKVIGEFEISRTGAMTEKIPHFLDFIPGYLVFYEVDGNEKWFPVFSNENQSASKNVIVITYADPTYITFTTTMDSSAVVRIKCFILGDQAE